MISQVFKAREVLSDYPANGNFIYIKQSPGTVTIRTRAEKGGVEKEYELEEREQILLRNNEEFTQITVKNDSDIEGIIDVKTGYGQFVSSGDNQKIQISNVDPMEVEFNGAQPVEFETPPKVTIASQSLNALASIALDGTQQTIGANSDRKTLILQAALTNNNEIVIAGFLRLQPGEEKRLPVHEAVTAEGVPGDALYVGELV